MGKDRQEFSNPQEETPLLDPLPARPLRGEGAVWRVLTRSFLPALAPFRIPHFQRAESAANRIRKQSPTPGGRLCSASKVRFEEKRKTYQGQQRTGVR